MLGLLLGLIGVFALEAGELVKVGGGTYVPFTDGFPKREIAPFEMQKYPVTNQQFLQFVQSNPKYQRSRISRILADSNYLKFWIDDLSFPKEYEDRPVTSVSWHVARQYCRHQGMELPTTAQWELAANAREFQSEILKWYSTPGVTSGSVGSTFATSEGVWDIHALIWEWVLDFDAEAPVAESEAFCGAAASGAVDTTNYTAFLRYGLRNSLKADYTVRNMGFRCVAVSEE